MEPGGRIGHAEIELGGHVIMVSAAYPEYGILDPSRLGGTTVTLHLHVDDAEAWGRRAVTAGAEMILPPTDQFHGERTCKVRDPFGHEWLLGHEIERVSHAEMQRRFTALCEG